jgi:hypothetical protein
VVWAGVVWAGVVWAGVVAAGVVWAGVVEVCVRPPVSAAPPRVERSAVEERAALLCAVGRLSAG